ncbi:uncharacterized protein LOC112468715, partial [Temnothorax curvispinosus]|uniref:Uncharacterized protein LOC112468715 n=1 Tax=Temnothorax curvispinosus TaxID=300111 RepID=A0A6J1RFP8_9HYME
MSTVTHTPARIRTRSQQRPDNDEDHQGDDPYNVPQNTESHNDLDELIPLDRIVPADEQLQQQYEAINLSAEKTMDTPTENERKLLAQVQELTAQLMEIQRAAKQQQRQDSVVTLNTDCGPAGEKAAEKTGSQAYGDEDQFNAGRLQMVPIQARLPRGGWIKSPFDDLTFIGKTDKQNPIRFLEKFEKLAKYEGVSEEEQMFYFGKCMRGAASQRHELQLAESIEEIKDKFRQYFWGCQAQMRFRQQIYFGKYKPGTMSMTEYALNMARQAKTLRPPMTDEELVQTLREHFDGDVARELRPSIAKTVTDMIDMLDTLENERETRRLRGEARRTSDKPTSRATNGSSQTANRSDETKDGGRQNNFARRDATRNSPQTKSTSWRKADTPDTRKRGDVDIIEEPDSDDSQAKPRVTRYTRDGNNNPRKETVRSGYRPDTRTTRPGERGQKLAAITAKETEREAENTVEETAESEESDKECCLIQHEAPNRAPSEEKIDDIIDEIGRKLIAAGQETVECDDVPMIEFEYCAGKVKAVVDTGSQITAMTKQLREQLEKSGEPIKKVPTRLFKLKGAFSNEGVPIRDQVQVGFRYERKIYEHRYYVVDELAYDIVLGMDFHTKFCMKLVCHPRTEVRFLRSGRSYEDGCVEKAYRLLREMTHQMILSVERAPGYKRPVRGRAEPFLAIMELAGRLTTKVGELAEEYGFTGARTSRRTLFPNDGESERAGDNGENDGEPGSESIATMQVICRNPEDSQDEEIGPVILNEVMLIPLAPERPADGEEASVEDTRNTSASMETSIEILYERSPTLRPMQGRIRRRWGVRRSTRKRTSTQHRKTKKKATGVQKRWRISQFVRNQRRKRHRVIRGQVEDEDVARREKRRERDRKRRRQKEESQRVEK